MNKDDFELICDFLIFQGFYEPAVLLREYKKAVEHIIENSLEFDWSESGLSKSFEVYQRSTK